MQRAASRAEQNQSQRLLRSSNPLLTVSSQRQDRTMIAFVDRLLSLLAIESVFVAWHGHGCHLARFMLVPSDIHLN